MYNILSTLYENEIIISKFLFLELNKKLPMHIIILKIKSKINKLLVDLITDINTKIDDFILNTYENKIRVRKFIQLEEYIQVYIFDMKNVFIENINIFYEDIHNNTLNDTIIDTISDTINDTIIDTIYDTITDTISDTITYNNLIDNNIINTNITKIKNIDKFYTNIDIVYLCLNKFYKLYNISKFDLVIEPSAGSGNFLLNINHNNKIGLDIEPDHISVIKQDFLHYYPDTNLYKNILTIGNPPFGRICSLAIKFFNHAANFSNMIAFIIPRSFRKISVQNKLDVNFKLIYDMDIPNKLNTFNPPVNVKCCFQIWIKNNKKRIIKKLDVKHKDWEFLNYNKDNILLSDFTIRAYGGNCGEIIEDNFDKLNMKAWHFIKSKLDKDILISRFRSLNYDLSKNTARQNSLGKAELIDLYTKKYNNI